MSNLLKFDQTLEALSAEVKHFKDISASYRKLQQLSKTYSGLLTQIEKNSNELNVIGDLLKSQKIAVDKSISNLEALSKKNIADLSKSLDEKIDTFKAENKNNLLEIEKTTRLKLEDNRLQIKQLIESERDQMRQIFEIQFHKNRSELIQKIESEFQKQTLLFTSNQKVIKYSIWFLGAILFMVILYFNSELFQKFLSFFKIS